MTPVRKRANELFLSASTFVIPFTLIRHVISTDRRPTGVVTYQVASVKTRRRSDAPGRRCQWSVLSLGSSSFIPGI